MNRSTAIQTRLSTETVNETPAKKIYSLQTIDPAETLTGNVSSPMMLSGIGVNGKMRSEIAILAIK